MFGERDAPSPACSTCTGNKVNVAWTEAGVTWNSFYSSASPQFDAAVSASSGGDPGVHTYDVTSLVTAWYAGPNNGLLIEEGSFYCTNFPTSEDPDASNRPKFDICYTPPPANTSCLAIQTGNPSSPDGVYEIDPDGPGGNAPTNAYCDMTGGGVTYRDFGFGQHSTSYSGWTWLTGQEFQSNSRMRAAFVYFYNGKAGLTNLQPGFTSNNCCIAGQVNAPRVYGFAGSLYMYPANFNGQINCNSTYTDPVMKLFLAESGPTKSSFTAAAVANTQLANNCGLANNPGIFARRYQ